MRGVAVRSVAVYGAAAAGLLVAAIVAVAAFQSMQVPLTGPTTGNVPVATDCSPTPCADVRGYQLHITNVAVNGNLVSMQLIFRNSSSSTHASPEDLELIDSKRHASGLVTNSPGCNTWPRHEFNNGAVFGPIDVCFRVTTAAPPLTLQWSPDFGLTCCQTDVKIA